MRENINITLIEGSTSWNTMFARAMPATMPSSLAKKKASTTMSEGMVARDVTSPTIVLGVLSQQFHLGGKTDLTQVDSRRKYNYIDDLNASINFLFNEIRLKIESIPRKQKLC